MANADFRSLKPDVQESIRRQAVSDVLKGKPISTVARLHGISRMAVHGWIRQHTTGGSAALAAKKRGRPLGGSLKPWQAAQISRSIVDRCPDQMKLPFCLWTRDAVGTLIKRRFDITVSRWTVGRYLARWGFTPQKPMRRAYERNPEAVRAWLSYQFPQIRRRAKEIGSVILWGDEMGLRSDHTTGTSFGLRGQTPVIAGTGQRFGCNMISAIGNRGELFFMVYVSKFQARTFIEFLARLIRQIKRNVFLIVDGHPVHRSGIVKRWLKRHENALRLFRLPGYSPELNPDELLNQDVKSNAVGRQRPKDRKEMVSIVRSHLRSRQKQTDVVKNFFNEEHVNYAAAV
jgi:transposase